MSSSTRARRRLGEVLVDSGLINEEQLHELLTEQMDPGRPRRRLGLLAVEHGLATERQVASALASSLGLTLLDLTSVSIDMEVARLVPRGVCERFGLMVLGREGSTLSVAVTDPTDIVALDEVRQRTGTRELKLRVVTDTQLRDQLARMWSASGEVVTLFDDDGPADELDDLSAVGVDDAPVVRLVDTLISDALGRHASDVHVEPQASEVRIRFRIDGMLRDVMTVPRSVLPSLVSRLKIISGLDIAERRRPQDGRARLAVGGSQLDTRVSTLPALHGEKVVIRLLARSTDMQQLNATGLTPAQLELMLPALAGSQGLVLLTGPTGSGKTSTLYSAITHLRTPDKNVVTLEDPIEIALPGITQVQVSERSGLTFSLGLRSVLRQDPDIVLVGEIRDRETAELALQASMTGHLVLSTLHTNGAVQALTRLVDMGMEPFLIASSLTLVVAQRLVRRPCEACASPYRPNPRTVSLLGLTEEMLEGSAARRGRGCPACGDTGYQGRVGIFEVLPVSAGMRQVLIATPTEGAVALAARAAGMVTLRQAGVQAALRGDTTFEEVLRATEADGQEFSLRCPSCARGVSDQMACCPYCATELGRPACGACGQASQPGWRVCPFCRAALEQPHPAPPAAEHAGGAAPVRAVRVLAVDDDPSVTGWLKAGLDGTAEVTGVHTADDALARLAADGTDLVILDLTLPDLSGTELVRLLRSDPKTVLLPILLLTGSTDDEALRQARLAGADAVLTKPAEPAELEATVLRLLDPAWHPEALPEATPGPLA